MLYYNVEYHENSRDRFSGGSYLVRVEDGSLDPFFVTTIELPTRAQQSEDAFHSYVQGLIAVRLKARRLDTCRLPAGRHDRGWPH